MCDLCVPATHVKTIMERMGPDGSPVADHTLCVCYNQLMENCYCSIAIDSVITVLNILQLSTLESIGSQT